ncbi:hypothetical protein SpCBS45565_g03722 [Spizellomyces sp. 'palustris']|nr:hypothetical protein SpCBS45565_g03722 [Spizellomyces sp. 'palustris']
MAHSNSHSSQHTSMGTTRSNDDPLAVYTDIEPEPPRPRPIQYYSNGKRIPRMPAKIKLPLMVTSTERYHSSATSGPANFNAWWKVNMWQRPFQVESVFLLSWFILGLLGYYFLVVRFFSGTERIAFTVLPGAFSTLAFLLASYTGSVDTEDPRVPAADVERNVRFTKLRGVPVINKETHYCHICQVKVDENTKHCKPCNKCVDGFDHHCDFLGQDIGRRNYATFFAALIFGWLFAFWNAAISLYAFALYFKEPTMFHATVGRILNDRSGTFQVIAAVIFVYACVMVFTGGAGLTLTIFHCKLIYLGMPTWRFIELEKEYECGAGPDPWTMRSKRSVGPRPNRANTQMIQVDSGAVRLHHVPPPTVTASSSDGSLMSHVRSWWTIIQVLIKRPPVPDAELEMVKVESTIADVD